MKQNQLTAVLLALLLFGCGFAAGALAHRFYRESVVTAKVTAEDARQQYVSEMRSKLRLTPAQITQLHSILDETKAKARAVRERYHPEMARIKQDQITRVKAILTPDQVPKYEQLVAERERRFQEERGDRSPGRPRSESSPAAPPASAPSPAR